MEKEGGSLLAWAKELQAMAAAGIQYTTNDFDRERFLRIRDIAAEMAAYELDLPPGRMKDVFALELGYQTPKVVTRAAIFDGDRVLLVREAGTESGPCLAAGATRVRPCVPIPLRRLGKRRGYT